MSPDPIVDSHTHVVSRDHDAYPLDPRDLSGEWYREAPASAEDLAREMDAAGVGQAVLVQGVGAYTWDNRYAADSARARPDRFVSACAIDVEAADAVATLDDWIQERGMQGIRIFALPRDGHSWLADPGTFPIWERARTLGIHVIVTVLPNQLDDLGQVLDRFADLPVSLDHCGFALSVPSSREKLFALARHPNLHLKVSTHNLDDAVREHGSARSMIAELDACFGAHRLMWGSDYCQTHDRPYSALVALGRDAFAGLAPEKRAACLGGNARRLWPALARSG